MRLELDLCTIAHTATYPQFFVIFKPVTNTSVLCADLRPYTPSVFFSLPVVTRADFSPVQTSLLLIAQVTLSPLTDIAISCSTGWPTAAALLTAGSGVPRPFIRNGAGPTPRTMDLPAP